MDFENLEKAIEILANPMANQDAEIKRQANDYLSTWVNENFQGFFQYLNKLMQEGTSSNKPSSTVSINSWVVQLSQSHKVWDPFSKLTLPYR